MVDNIISSLGGGSGINTSQLVDDLVAAERLAPDERLNSRQTKLESQLSGYGVLTSAMSSFQDTLALLKDPDTFNAKTVAFPNTDVVTPVEIQPDAQAGDYSIEVLEIAQAHSLTSASFDATTTSIGTGTLTFNFGTWDDGAGGEGFSAFSIDSDKTPQTITIDESNNTLSGLRDAINDADFGVQASIVADGDGYRLLVTAPSGASNELEIVASEDGGSPTNNDDSGLSLFAFNTGGSQMTASQGGIDARMRVNGFEVSRSSNQVDDVVDGLDFTLNKAAEGEVISFSISSDTSGAQEAVYSFVDAYNEFVSTITELVSNAEADEDDEDSYTGALRSDATTKGILNQVRSMISSTVSGADANFNALAFVGIKTELDGSLSIEQEVFDEAFDDNFDELVQLFTPSVSSTSSLIEVAQYKDATAAGSYDVVITAQPGKGNLTTDEIVNTGAAFDYVSGGTFNTTFTPSSPDYDFAVTVDGTKSETLSLSGSFDTLEEMRDELQALINGDVNLKKAGAAVDVTIVGDTLQFESRQYGGSSKVTFSDQGTGISNLGFGDGQGVVTTGNNVAGTINGVAGFGSGNILLPEYGSDLAGLSLRITPGATSATVTYGQGFATQLNNLFEEYMSSTGIITERETTIEGQLDDVEEDRETLDARMERRFTLLQAQFIQMEAIISSLNTTSDSLSGLFDTLPFTASGD